MQCLNHPEREAVAVCWKNECGYCESCCECLTVEECCECFGPDLFCKYRTRCLIWEMSRDRRKKRRG